MLASMFFEAMDLYWTLDLKSNPMGSSHFENNFKRTINCPATRANMNEPSQPHRHGGFWWAYPPKQSSKPPQIEMWNTINK